MRPRLPIVLGAAVLGGIAAASLASAQPGPHTAVQLIAPASVSGDGLLGAPGGTAGSHGLLPAWMLVPTLPDLPAPAGSSGSAAEPAAQPTPAPVPVPAAAPLAAVLASAPVHVTAVAGTLPSPPLPALPLPLPGVGHAGGHRHGAHH